MVNLRSMNHLMRIFCQSGVPTVRSPEYQIIKSYKEKGLYKVIVLVKKNKRDQITEAQKELNLDDDMIKKLLLN